MHSSGSIIMIFHDCVQDHQSRRPGSVPIKTRRFHQPGPFTVHKAQAYSAPTTVSDTPLSALRLSRTLRRASSSALRCLRSRVGPLALPDSAVSGSRGVAARTGPRTRPGPASCDPADTCTCTCVVLAVRPAPSPRSASGRRLANSLSRSSSVCRVV